MSEQLPQQKNIQKLLEAGAEIVGATAGGAIGLIAGPVGAIYGGAAGVVVSKGLIEFIHRILSKRERARVGAAASLTIVGIEERIKAGEQLREDNFFNGQEEERSKADELFEGVLIKCRDEYEEKKIKYITKLYENVAFDTSISPENANQILNTAQQLSYRQLVIIALIGENQNNEFNLRLKDYRGEDFAAGPVLTQEQEFVLQDFKTLNNQGLIERADNTVIQDISDVAPARMRLSLIGKSYFDFLSLYNVPPEEITFLDYLKD